MYRHLILNSDRGFDRLIGWGDETPLGAAMLDSNMFFDRSPKCRPIKNLI